MSSFTLSTEVALPYDDAVTATRSALADVGFGVLTEIDLSATLHTKLGVDVPPQVILGACRPQLAHEATTLEPSVATLLPCNVVVRDLGGGSTLVEAMDPEAMSRLSGDDRLDPVVADARRRLTDMLAAVAQTAATES